MHSVLLVSVFLIVVVRARDPLYDFEDTPGGGPSTLRECATWAFIETHPSPNIGKLGCLVQDLA